MVTSLVYSITYDAMYLPKYIVSRQHNEHFHVIHAIEYQVEPCRTGHKHGNGCLHVKRTSLPMQRGGYVIYGVAHQHAGGTGSTLYGQRVFLFHGKSHTSVYVFFHYTLWEVPHLCVAVSFDFSIIAHLSQRCEECHTSV
ncbi:hypothetical protein VNO78_10946 [Psophocarpus tetragonolobus]|uniref:Uncharacterized protein n=1 Tax=Psophocarpus tetragonolobus TaxID=3891 RepID=A0AAN9XNG2_PSOTE